MEIQVHKFGGASVKDSEGIRRVETIIRTQQKTKMIMVVSAMGKNTNVFESIWTKYLKSGKGLKKAIKKIIETHLGEAAHLGLDSRALTQLLKQHAKSQLAHLSSDHTENSSLSYDQIVSLGELFSTVIVHAYFESRGYSVLWHDIRKSIKTDATYREAVVDMQRSTKEIKKLAKKAFGEYDIIITQGFLGRDNGGYTTTLGREGSDYTAAIVASALEVEELTVWKDVPGIMTADPKRYPDARLMPRMSYREAIEMTYYGAKVIHPKTIQPIQRKGIQLRVRSFIKPQDRGTTIGDFVIKKYPPIIVVEDGVALLSIISKDFSFIAGEHLSDIFGILKQLGVRICVMRNSAVSFMIALSNLKASDGRMIRKKLKDKYRMDLVTGLQLLTIRHSKSSLEKKLIENRTVYFEERLDNVVQVVVE